MQLQLGAFVLGGLSAAEAAAVRAHLDACVQCRAEHEELAAAPSWLDLLRPDFDGGGPGRPRETGRGRGRASDRPDDPGDR